MSKSEQPNHALHQKENSKPKKTLQTPVFRILRNLKDAILKIVKVWYRGRTRNQRPSTNCLTQSRAFQKRTSRSILTHRSTQLLIWRMRCPCPWIRVVSSKRFRQKINLSPPWVLSARRIRLPQKQAKLVEMRLRHRSTCDLNCQA